MRSEQIGTNLYKNMYSDKGSTMFTKGNVYDFMEFLGAYIVYDDLGQEHDVNGRLRGLGRWDRELIEDHFDEIN